MTYGINSVQLLVHPSIFRLTSPSSLYILDIERGTTYHNVHDLST